MIEIPFQKDGFAQTMKPLISGLDLDLEFENIESSLAKVSVTCSKLLGKELYNKLCSGSASQDSGLQERATEYLQRAMLHFAIYEHFPYLMIRIGNDGVTVTKSQDKTTVFKYQEDDLKNNLITTGWFWMNFLIKFLNENKDAFPDWNPDENINTDIPIELTDFEKWVGVSDEYFFLSAKWLIREVWNECVLSRTPEPKKADTMTRAVCYEVMGRACKRMPYMILPEPIRKDTNNEMGKNHAAQADKHIRDTIAGDYLRHAGAYWTRWEVELNQAATEAQEQRLARKEYTRPIVSERDKFCM